MNKVWTLCVHYQLFYTKGFLYINLYETKAIVKIAKNTRSIIPMSFFSSFLHTAHGQL